MIGHQPEKGWAIVDGKLAKVYLFRDYHQTMAFVNALAWISHREGHHPDLEVGYRQCRVINMSYVCEWIGTPPTIAPPDAPAPRALDMLQQLAAIDPLFERQVMAKHAIVGARVIVAQFLGSLFVVATAGKYAAIYLTVSHRLSPNGGFISAFTDGSEDSSIAAFSSIHSACEAGDRKPADLLADVLAVGSLALSARLAKSVVFSCYRVVAGHTFLAALRAHSSHHHIGARRERGHGYPDDLSVAGAPAQDGRVVVNRFARRNDLDAFFFDQDVAHKGLPWLTRRLRFCDYYSTPVLIVG